MIIGPEDNYRGLDEWLAGKGKVFLVCDSSVKFLDGLNAKLDSITADKVIFSSFRPNPLYEEVAEGVRLFRREKCDCIIAVGGGSSMDVAKCIKAYAEMDGDGENGNWLQQPITANGISFLAIPTTAGTGSEATRYAVIYYEGKKQSVTSETFIPETVLMDPDTLITLPPYQKKATMCDALAHAIESYWSVNSTDRSKEYARRAISMVLANAEGYLENTAEGRRNMLTAAHLAGKAINITQTTAGHAMCYKITSLLGCAHGHAAILCDRILFPWMTGNTGRCIDPRGEDYLIKTLDEIGQAMGGSDAKEGADMLSAFFDRLDLQIPSATKEQFAELTEGVNPVRLKNHPVELDKDTIEMLYHEILNEA